MAPPADRYADASAIAEGTGAEIRVDEFHYGKTIGAAATWPDGMRHAAFVSNCTGWVQDAIAHLTKWRAHQANSIDSDPALIDQAMNSWFR